MSNTRHASPDAPLRQERYASSPALERGLMANLVAGRCRALNNPELRELLWFIQRFSHEGGLKKLAAVLLEQYGARLGTKSMRSFGVATGRVYTSEEVRVVRRDLPASLSYGFPLRSDEELVLDAWGYAWGPDRSSSAVMAEQAEHPSSYPAKAFLPCCREAASERLQEYLAELCLNPALDLEEGGPWYFYELIDCLRDYHRACVAERCAKVVVTTLGRLVYGTLDFALQEHRLVLIDGLARTGKSFAAQEWCATHPGRARYVQVPSTNDDIGFFRAIATSLGVSINLNSKAQELRQRIEETLQGSDLLVCLDEAHYLWPTSNYRQAMPSRLNWIMTALVNHGVPVALVTTPQFLRSQRALERRTHWTSEQFIGRIGHYQPLPESLPDSDLNAVAKALWPEGDEQSVDALVTYTKVTAKYLAGIDAVVARARFLATRAGRGHVSRADIKQALKESAIPSDNALVAAISKADAPALKGHRRPKAVVLHAACTHDAAPDAQQTDGAPFTDPEPNPQPPNRLASRFASPSVTSL